MIGWLGLLAGMVITITMVVVWKELLLPIWQEHKGYNRRLEHMGEAVYDLRMRQGDPAVREERYKSVLRAIERHDRYLHEQVIAHRAHAEELNKLATQMSAAYTRIAALEEEDNNANRPDTGPAGDAG